MSWLKIEVPTVSCDLDSDGNPKATRVLKNIQVLATLTGSESAKIQAEFEEMAKISEKLCLQQSGVLSLPERYQLSIEAKIPQLVCLFRELKTDGSLGWDWYPVTIPHPLNTDQSKQTALPNYKKGSWELILILKDNTKVFVNAFSTVEAQKMVDSIKLQINTDYLATSYQKIGQRKGQPLKEITVKMVRADYYPNGPSDPKPKWTKRFK